MSPKWIAGMVLFWLVITIVSLIGDFAYLGGDESSLIGRLLNPGYIEGTEEQGGVFAMSWEYVEVFFNMLFLNYSFLTGVWEVIKYIYWALAIGTIVRLAIDLKPSWL